MAFRGGFWLFLGSVKGGGVRTPPPLINPETPYFTTFLFLLLFYSYTMYYYYYINIMNTDRGIFVFNLLYVLPTPKN